MIKTFKDRDSRNIAERRAVKKFASHIQRQAQRKLMILNNAQELHDLRVPPGNRLEKLEGNRRGQHSIRINAQYRICFEWYDGDASEVEIVDYH